MGRWVLMALEVARRLIDNVWQTVVGDDAGASPGGSSAPITRASYGGNNVSVPNSGSLTSLTWDDLLSGDALLDLSVPALPTIVTTGVYALAVNVAPATAMTDGKAYRLYASASDAAMAQTVAIADSADFDSFGLVAFTYYMTAGDPVQVQVQHADVGAVNFYIAQAVLQRLA